MERNERFHKILQLFNERRPVPRQRFLVKLGNACATFTRDIDGQLFAPALDGGYGTLIGSATQTSVLRLTPECARWVAREHWRPKQQSLFDERGFYLLDTPCPDPRDIMEILKFGPDVEVLKPETLRVAVIDRTRTTRKVYG